MSNQTRPPLHSIHHKPVTPSPADQDDALKRELAAQHGLIPTVSVIPPTASPIVASEQSQAQFAPAVRKSREYPKPAPTVPLQLKLPDYLVEKLRKDAETAGMTVKELIMEVLVERGYEVSPIDLRDLRRR